MLVWWLFCTIVDNHYCGVSLHYSDGDSELLWWIFTAVVFLCISLMVTLNYCVGYSLLWCIMLRTVVVHNAYMVVHNAYMVVFLYPCG